ncbi:MAG: hypothetical protein OEY93_01340 [Anaerolineae bacterium]|nr:hypothetical protein [Anaerolineae bacterium]
MYIDPNTGGILAQTLIIVFTAASGMILAFNGRIKMWIAKMRRSNDDADSEE